MDIRNFQLDTEWNIIHYPEKPQGFGILVIGDENHFVDEKTSNWLQNEGKQLVLKSFLQAGYTTFYSNLYGRNWGSNRAVYLAKRLYEYVIRKEILNTKIHIIAEGMGALVALKLIKEMNSDIRSLVLINPILSLKNHLEQEKDRKFFYKKIIKELSLSYEVEEGQILQDLKEIDAPPLTDTHIPIKIIHILGDSRAYKQSKLLNKLSEKWEEEQQPISLSYMVSEKRRQIGTPIIQFFNRNESIL